MKVFIPFMERFREPLLNGTKTWTSRTKQYGVPNDTFPAFGAEFVILAIERKQLSEILEHWREEGCLSRDDALEVWRMIHPVRRLDLSELFFVHVFRRISI